MASNQSKLSGKERLIEGIRKFEAKQRGGVTSPAQQKIQEGEKRLARTGRATSPSFTSSAAAAAFDRAKEQARLSEIARQQELKRQAQERAKQQAALKAKLRIVFDAKKIAAMKTSREKSIAMKKQQQSLKGQQLSLGAQFALKQIAKGNKLTQSQTSSLRKEGVTNGDKPKIIQLKIPKGFESAIAPAPKLKPKFIRELVKIKTGFQKRSDIAVKNLEKINKGITDTLSTQAEIDIRKEAERLNAAFETEQFKINRGTEKFNQKFGNKELDEKQFKEAERSAKDLEKRQKDLNFNSENLSDTINKFEKSKGKDIGQFPVAFTKGFATAIPGLAQFAVSIVSRPITTVKETGAGIAQLPAQIKVAPFTTLGNLAGTIAGQSLLFKTIKSTTSTKSLKRSNKKFITKVKKPKGIKKTPLSKTFKTEVSFKINDNAVRSFAKDSLKKRGIDFNKLSKVDQNFITGQIKAKLRSQPQEFIPNIRKLAIKRVKANTLRKAVQERLQGKFDKPIRFTKVNKKVGAKVNAQQRLVLKRLAENLEKQRISKVVTKRLEAPKIKLTELQRSLIKKRVKAQLKSSKLVAKSKKRLLKRLSKQQEAKVISRAIRKGRTQKLKPADLVSKSDKNFIRGQIKAQIRTQPEKFIGGARGQLLRQVKRTKQIQKAKPTFQVVSKDLSSTQRLALKRFKQTQKKNVKVNLQIKNINKQQVKVRSKINKLEQKPKLKQIPRGAVVGEPLLNRLAGTRRLSQYAKKSGLIQSESEFVRLPNALKSKIKTNFARTKTINRLKLKVKQNIKLGKGVKTLTKQLRLNKGKVILALRSIQKSRTNVLQKVKQKQFSKQAQAFSVSVIKEKAKIIQLEKEKLKLKQKSIIFSRSLTKQVQKLKQKKIFIPRAKSVKVGKKKKKRRGYNVFARPLKKRKGQKRPKLRRINKAPLTKRRAKDLRNYVVDTSLSRTGKIKATRLKARKAKIKSPVGYAKRTRKKFRTHRIVKGKRVKLRNAVIEKRGKALLDTQQERRGITLAKRLRQLSPKKQKKVRVKKKSARRITNGLTKKQTMLKNLAKARRVRKSNLKKKK